VFAGGEPATFADGPNEIEVVGVSGVEASIAGLAGSRTGQPLLAEAIVLYGEEASYVLIAQYEPAHQTTMLSAWQRMLKNLDLPDNRVMVDDSHTVASPVRSQLHGPEQKIGSSFRFGGVEEACPAGNDGALSGRVISLQQSGTPIYPGSTS